ncbi:8-amino-7-oxononanoate synthase [Nocardioides panacisoli]|uniref:8-amino-7-oxononanoate synthase n=1 Tax=Nocardioides panacisoli TaxID=627624 RepID=UPI001C62AA15|nr:8-amino-7-oxononanoate synthase [Nocardioides panacisoli]QYJ04499.1 8-amino-7-oxononanoate synthase [Nocardioides panacisoli]
MTWQAWLAERAAERDRSGLTRRLVVRDGSAGLLDLAGNDYLGLAQDSEVRRAAAEAALAWGAGAGASRLVTGTLPVHDELERSLADYTGQESGLVLSSGYAANLAAVTALADRSTHVISDAHVHASLIDAVRLSRAEVSIVEHNDVTAVTEALGRDAERTLVVVESVYSVLGDAAPLVDLAEACRARGALLLVDEAHGLGVRGPGLVAELGLAGLPHVLVTATLSKALGSQGGIVLGTRAVREHLVNTARPFIFDTALSPAATAAAHAALDIARERPHLARRVAGRVRDLAGRLGVTAPDGAVLSVPMPSPERAVAARDAAAAAGLRVGCFRPPSVPDGISRLRVTVNAGIDAGDWERAADVLQSVVKEFG